MKNLGFPSARNEKKFFYRGKIIISHKTLQTVKYWLNLFLVEKKKSRIFASSREKIFILI
jgi:hypothetical protein